MKSKLFLSLLALSIMAFLTIGCGEKEKDADLPATDKVDETTGAVEEVVKTFETMKDEYLTKAGTLVADWDKKILSLEEKKKDLPAIARKPLEKQFRVVMDNKDALDNSYNELKNADEATFDAKKEAFETTMTELNTGYTDLLAKF